MNVPDFSAGEELSAVKLNALARVLRKLTLRARPPLYVTETPDGAVLEYRDAQEMDVKVTSGTNPYAGREQSPTAAGGWTDMAGGRAPTATVDPLYERNGARTVAVGTVVRARRDPASGAWIFDRNSCSATSSPAPPPAPRPSPAPLEVLGGTFSPKADLVPDRAPAATFTPAWASTALAPLNARDIDKTLGGGGTLTTNTAPGGPGGPG